MARRFFSGASLEQAVLAAARHFETEPERIAYAERERRHGVLNLRRKVAIEVDPESPFLPEGEEQPWQPKLAGVTVPLGEASKPPASNVGGAQRPERADEKPRGQARAADAGSSRPQEVEKSGEGQNKRRGGESDRSPRHTDDEAGGLAGRGEGTRAGGDGRQEGRRGSGRQDDRRRDDRGREEAPREAQAQPVQPLMDDPLDAADDALGEIADFLLFDLQWEIRQEDDESLSIDLSGEDSERIVAEDGYVMRAIEHLLPRLIRSRHGNSMQVRVDCDGFQAKHEDEMMSFAEGIADEVDASGESRLLEPMTPGDRRLIHVTLADDSRVETQSEGDGFTKRVRVSPA